MKKVITCCMVLAALLAASGTASAQSAVPRQVELQLNSDRVLIDGIETKLDTMPLVIEGTTLLPVRFVCQDILGSSVVWDAAERKISVFGPGQSVELVIDSKAAVVTGETVELQQPPRIVNGRTLVPLRFLSESMALNVKFDPATKKITVEAGETLPLADFYFLETDIRVGQSVRVEDKSMDPEGDEIVERRWEILSPDGSRSEGMSPEQFFPVKSAGMYTIRLQVMDAEGVWSPWAEKKLEIKPNQPPVITRLSAGAGSVAQGERLTFSYDVLDETFDSVQEERWSYRWRESSGQVREIIGKPEALFGQRDYTVCLRVRDAFNNWSSEAVVQVRPTKEKVVSELEYKFSNPKPGDVVLNGDDLNHNILEDTDYTVDRSATTLIVSNSPETVREPGIVYQDSAQGPVRVFYHHKNSTGTNCRVVVWARNKTSDPVNVSILKRGTGGPSTDEMFLGQKVNLNYFDSEPAGTISIRPGQVVTLNEVQSTAVLRPGDIAGGMINLDCSGKIEFTVAVIKTDHTVMSPLAVLNSDGVHVRVTFSGADLVYDVETGMEPSRIILGRGLGEDTFLQGTDALTGENVINTGNYGVVYEFRINSQSAAGILLNPRGTRFRGVFQGFDGNAYAAPAAGTLNYFTLGAVVGTLPGSSNGTFTYTPSSGSDTPVVVAFYPEESW